MKISRQEIRMMIMEQIRTIGLGGLNSDGPYTQRYVNKYPNGNNTGGYVGNPDSQISQRQSLISTLDEDAGEEDEEESIEEMITTAALGAVPVLPIGKNAKNQINSPKKEKERHQKNKKFFGGN